MERNRETYRQRNARHRTCPNCQRGAALTFDLDEIMRRRWRSCRWCGYAAYRELRIDGGDGTFIITEAGDPSQRKASA